MKSTIERRKTGLIYWDQDWSSGCYTLYAPQTGNGLVKLIDISGDTVYEWNMPVRPGRDAVLIQSESASRLFFVVSYKSSFSSIDGCLI